MATVTSGEVRGEALVSTLEAILRDDPANPQAHLRLARAQRLLRALQRDQSRVLRRTSYATVAVGLRTKEAEQVVPTKPGRIERALDRAGHVLVRELEKIGRAHV